MKWVFKKYLASPLKGFSWQTAGIKSLTSIKRLLGTIFCRGGIHPSQLLELKEKLGIKLVNYELPVLPQTRSEPLVSSPEQILTC